MLKKLLIVAVIIVLLLVAGVVFVISQVDGLVKRGIEEAGTYALQVPVTVEAADLSITASPASLGITGLAVANPQGFGEADERFMGLADSMITLDGQTIGEPVVRMPSVTVSGIDLLLVKAGSGANYQTILDSLKRFEAEPGAEPDPEPAPAPGDPPAQRVVIDEIVLRDIDVVIRYDSGIPAAGLMSLDVPIDEIRLEGVGEDPDNPVDVNDVVSVVLKALLNAVIAEAGGVLPPDFVEDLQGSLQELASLGTMGVEMATELGADAQQQLEEVGRQVEQQLGEVGGEVERAIEGATREAGEAAGRIGGEIERGIGGLIPGRRGSEPPTGGDGGDEGDAGNGG